MTVTFDAEVWEHDGDAGWHFVSLPTDDADAIADRTRADRRGFGSVRVEVTLGGSTWRTSLFPDTRRGTYVLPIRKAVRTAEAIGHGSQVTIELSVLPSSPST